jgi:hypothetical protein
MQRKCKGRIGRRERWTDSGWNENGVFQCKGRIGSRERWTDSDEEGGELGKEFMIMSAMA